MRGILLSLVLIVLAGIATPPPAAATVVHGPAVSAGASHDFQTPGKDVKVDINVGRDDNAWYRNPVWIAIGIVAFVVIVLLIIVATRGGGGTTIVRD